MKPIKFISIIIALFFYPMPAPEAQTSPVKAAFSCEYGLYSLPEPDSASVLTPYGAGAADESLTFYYTIQVRARLGQASACSDIRQLRAAGYPAFIAYDHFFGPRSEEDFTDYGYTIHVASFKNAANVNRMLERLEGLGFPAFTVGPEAADSTEWRRVYAGVFPQRRTAVEYATALKRNGFSYSSVQALPAPLFPICIGHFADFESVRAAEAYLLRRGFVTAHIKRNPYTIQVGVYDNEQDIAALAKRLQDKGWAAYLLPQRTYRQYMRVLVGAFRLKEEADDIMRQLKHDGFDPVIGIR